VARVLPSHVPTLRRKVRILIEWTWAMFFPSDITHLRFTRSSRRRSITRVQKDGVSYKRKSARLTEEREP
jgi:NADH dehydrogenase